MADTIFNIGSVTKYRGVYNNQNTYYDQNVVTMCSCLFICTANEQQGAPPLVVANEESGEMAFANTSVWTCKIDNLELYNKTKRAIDVIGKAEQLTEEMRGVIDYALNMASHPLYISEDYYIMQWDYELQEYVNTGIYVRGRDLAWGEMSDDEKEDLCSRIFLDRILEPDIEEIIGKVGEPETDEEGCNCFPLRHIDILEACGDDSPDFKDPLEDVNGNPLISSDDQLLFPKDVEQ